MLHIAVHGDDSVAAGEVHAAGNGYLVPKVACKGKRPYMRVFFRKTADKFIGAVMRAVVHINQFIGHTRFFHDTGDGIVKKNDIVFLVVHRGNDRNHRRTPFTYNTDGTIIAQHAF